MNIKQVLIYVLLRSPRVRNLIHALYCTIFMTSTIVVFVLDLHIHFVQYLLSGRIRAAVLRHYRPLLK